jgi:hypothetical protein
MRRLPLLLIGTRFGTPYQGRMVGAIVSLATAVSMRAGQAPHSDCRIESNAHGEKSIGSPYRESYRWGGALLS